MWVDRGIMGVYGMSRLIESWADSWLTPIILACLLPYIALSFYKRAFSLDVATSRLPIQRVNLSVLPRKNSSSTFSPRQMAELALFTWWRSHFLVQALCIARWIAALYKYHVPQIRHHGRVTPTLWVVYDVVLKLFEPYCAYRNIAFPLAPLPWEFY